MVVIGKRKEDPALCCRRLDPSADIFGAKKSSMFDPRFRMRIEQPKMGKHSDKKCGHGGRSVGRSDPHADIRGHSLTKFRQRDQS